MVEPTTQESKKLDLNNVPKRAICPLIKGLCIREKCHLWLIPETSEAEAECSLVINTMISSALVGLMSQLSVQLSDIVDAGSSIVEDDEGIPNVDETVKEEPIKDDNPIPDLSLGL